MGVELDLSQDDELLYRGYPVHVTRGQQKRYDYTALDPQAIEILPPRQREVLHLRRYGLFPRDVAYVLQMSYSAVSFNSSVGLARIRERFTNPFITPPVPLEVDPMAFDYPQDDEPMETSHEVTLSAGQRDQLTFEEIFEKFQTRIYNHIYRLVENKGEAEELAQETFLRAYAGIGKIDGDLRVGPWLYRIGTNLAMDLLRRRKRIRWEVFPTVGQNDPAEDAPILIHPNLVDTNDPERLAARRETQTETIKVLKKISTRSRICLMLREYQGMSCEEIGQLMQMSASAVKSQLFRAREEFRYASQQIGSGTIYSDQFIA